MKRSIRIVEIKPSITVITLFIVVFLCCTFLSSLSHSQIFQCCCRVSGTLFLRCCGDDKTLVIGESNDNYDSCYYTSIEGECTDEERFIRHFGAGHSNCGDCVLIDGTVDCASTTTTSASQNDDCLFKDLLGYDNARLNVLRQFRDKVLHQSQEGRELIRLYYQWSPVIARTMQEDEEFKGEVKELVDGVLPIMGNVLVAE